MIDVSVSFLTKAFALSVPVGVVFCAVLALAYMWVLKNQDSGSSSGGASRGGARPSGGASRGGARPSGGASRGGARPSGGASRGGARGGGSSLFGGILKELGEGLGSAGAGVGRGVGDTLKGSADMMGKTLGGVGAAIKGTGEGGGKLLGGVGAAIKGTGEGGGKLLEGAGSGVGSVAKGVGEGGGKLLGGVGSFASGVAKPLGTLGNGVGRVAQAVRDEVVGDVWWGWEQYSGYRDARDSDDDDDDDDDGQLPRNVFDAGTGSDAETIRDICRAVGIEASVDGTHVAINPHKLKDAERVLAMADYDVTFADDDDDENENDVVLDFNKETGEWELAQGDKTWRKAYEEIRGQVLHWWDPTIYSADQTQAEPTTKEKVEA